MKRYRLLTSVLLFPVIAHGAGTIVSQRINAQNRLVPLEKLTVGPDDQYHGMADSSGTTLVFTRKSELVPHLCAQDLKSGEVRDFLPLEADSQEAAISPEGLVAFTYYKFSARGDICYRPLAEKDPSKITCLKGDGSERDAAFWRGPRELGFLTRNVRTLQSQIVSENIDTGKKEVLAEGRLWSPAMRPGGRYLFYNELGGADGQTRVLVMRDLQVGTTRTLRFQLPGISGFPAVSDDERYLYFSHYLNDTNNDNVIDGNDNSVVFRAPIAQLLKEGSVFPEQLTSAESNCSFPRPHGDKVYVTCALEGTLDVYQIPASGIVPAKWEEPLLWNAHKTSRTYQERILLLNTLKYRLGTRAQLDIDERLLSDHLLAKDVSAAKYYIEGLSTRVSPDQRAFYELLSYYLDGLQLKKTQPSDEVTRAFERQIMAIDTRVEKVKGGERMKKIVRAHLRNFLDQPRAAAAFLKGVTFDAGGESMERHLYFVAAKTTLPRVGNAPGLTEIYRQMMSAPELTDQSRIYYGFNYLQYLQDQKLSRRDRASAIEKMAAKVNEPVTTLLKSEVVTLRIIEAPDQKTKDITYKDLDKLITASKGDYFLRKALYIRSILNFADAADFKYLTYIATNWIRYTAQEDTEFQYAREVHINASLDRAYDTYAQKNYNVASGYFYGALSATDDLESHWGFIDSSIRNGERKTLETTYTNLKNRKFIDDNMKFVEALLGLVDARAEKREDVKVLDTAIEKLRAMEQDRDSPVRYLLLGYCYLEKLLLTSNGYEFDRALFDDAHRSLMLAYDLGRDNARIKASALADLGVLHQRVQNHGMAVKFFTKRKELGFTSRDEANRFAWIYAKSLFYTHQPDKAADELAQALSDDKMPAAEQTAFLERRAFYLENAGSFREAAAVYEKVLPTHRITGDLNLAKAHLAYGYTLYKLRREDEAKRELRLALGQIERLPVIPHGGERLVDFQPVRQKLIAYGLLARLGTPAEKLDAATRRGELLRANKGLFEDQTALLLQNRLQIAEIQGMQSPSRAVPTMNEAMALAESLGDAGQYLTHAVYQTTVDYLALGIRHPELYAKDDGRLKKVVEKSIAAYEGAKPPQPVYEEHRSKLQAMWARYQRR